MVMGIADNGAIPGPSSLWVEGGCSVSRKESGGDMSNRHT